jgi:hypothetical protein
MLMKKADRISDFRVGEDNGCRRVSVFGMGWTGYTLPRLDANNVFEDADFDDADEYGNIKLDIEYANSVAYEVVSDNDLVKMAHYFYNLGRQHGIETALEEDLFD